MYGRQDEASASKVMPSGCYRNLVIFVIVIIVVKGIFMVFSIKNVMFFLNFSCFSFIKHL